jgi:outer membrane protein assembly factor BamB
MTASCTEMSPRSSIFKREFSNQKFVWGCFLSLTILSGCFHSVEEVHLPPEKIEPKNERNQHTNNAMTPGEGDWPWWRGINRDNHATGPVPPTTWSKEENIVWKASVPGRGHATPILWDDQVFVVTADETSQEQFLIAYDRATGEQRWLTKLHQGSWPQIHVKNSQASSTPACDGNAIFTAIARAEAIWISAVDLKGNILWQKEAGPFEAEFGYGSSPVIYGSYLIVQSDNKNGGFVAALDRETGAVVWRVRRARNDSYGTPIVAHVASRDQLLTSGQHVVVSYDPATGNELWRCDGPSEATANTMAFRDDVVFASGGYSDTFVMAIRADGSGDVTSTHVLWKEQFKMYVPSALVIEDRLLVMGDNGVGVCYSAADGSQLWKVRIAGAFSASPVLVQDIVYVPDEKGVVHVFKASAEKHEKIAQNDLEDGGMASPVIADGRIYLRTAHALFCIADESQPGSTVEAADNPANSEAKAVSPAK